jgi:hypothetical protein
MRGFCLAALLCLAVPLAATERRALLVGVNNYARGPQDWQLRGCVNDAMMTRELLVGKFGFPPQNVKVLLDEEATARNILQAIQDWLVAPSQPDDVVYFHFSGHGSQTADQEGDEEDGADELICPTDMQQGLAASVITDDQLKAALGRIAARNVTVVLDACHSGTGTRDLSLSRPRYAEFDPGLRTTRNLTAVLAAPALTAPAAPAAGKLAGSGGMEKGEAEQVTISGCRAEQTSADAWIRDGLYAGALTYHLVEAMRGAPADITYRDLVERVVRDIQAKGYAQIPQVEGDMDRPLFGTRIADAVATPFVVVEAVQGDQVWVSGGRTRGLTTGSIYAVFPPAETRFQGEALGRIKITQVEENRAGGVLLDGSAAQPGCRATELLHGLELDRLRLRVESTDLVLQGKVLEALSLLHFVEVAMVDQRFDHRLQLSAAPGGVQANLTLDGAPGAPVTGVDVPALIEVLRPQLENAYAIQSLASLDNPAPPFQVEVWAERAGSQGSLDQAPKEQLVQAKVGDLIRFNFRAERDCYLSLVNLGTSGKVTVLFPNRYCPSGFVRAGKVYRTETPGEMPFKIRATGPAGRELVKAIATLDSLDLPSLRLAGTNSGGLHTVASGSRFVQQLTRDLAAEGTQEAPLLPRDGWSTDYLIVETSP